MVTPKEKPTKKPAEYEASFEFEKVGISNANAYVDAIIEANRDDPNAKGLPAIK